MAAVRLQPRLAAAWFPAGHRQRGPPGLQPSALRHLGSGSSWGGRRPGASAEVGGRVLGAALGEGLPPAPGPPAGSVTAPGDAPKALERRLEALGETQELAACVCVCAHTCERAARGPTGTSPRPPPAFLGAAVPASEGGAQPKPLGPPPPPPNKVPCLGNLKPVSSKIFY